MGFVILAQSIIIEEKKIMKRKIWPELKLVRDIQVFLDFANFYKRFIRNINRIAVLLIFILWIINETNKDRIQSSQGHKNQKYQKISTNINDIGNGNSITGDMEYLSTVEKAKS